MTSYGAYLFQTVIVLAIVCALAYATLWGMRRFGVTRPNSSIRLLGHLPLEPRRSVYVIAIGNRALVLGASEGGLTRLSEFAAEEWPSAPPSSEPPERRGFREVLRGLASRGERDEGNGP